MIFMATRGHREYIFGIFCEKKILTGVGIELVAMNFQTGKSIEQTNEPETDPIYKDHWFPTAEIPWQPIHKQSWECVYNKKN